MQVTIYLTQKFCDIMLDSGSWWDITCSTAFEKKKQGYIALVYEAYFDAVLTSVPKRDFPVHSVGVYLAKQDDWCKFRKEWKRDLRGIPYFHMTDFERDFLATKKGEPISRKSPFLGLKESEYLPLLKRIHKTIARPNKNGNIRIKGFASHIVKNAFDTLRPPELKKDPYCASYYIFNVAVLMKGIRNWMNDHKIEEPVHYIFSRGDREGNNLLALFDDLFDDLNRAKSFHLHKGFGRMGYDIEWMKAEPALQAADIGCYELHKLILLWIEMGYPDFMHEKIRRKSLSSLVGMGMEHRGWAYRGQQLREQFNERLREISGQEPY